ncbi:rhomboid family intramembrane serine protease [Sphingobium rhizovicinum]|uniref:Rhomboid family intramembrane serine protease n=1 Tax=Sphingobium rhizovicinum TaxID=432308 RepID=A0ABV7NHQ7_9SPHN
MSLNETNGPEAQVAATDDLDIQEIVLPWHHYVPGILLIAPMTLAFILYFFSNGMVDWAISAQKLRQGQYAPIILHMFAHGSIMHIVMNGTALYSLSAVTILRLGGDAVAWAKFYILFLLSGLVGAATYLAFHPYGTTPMLGASGAIFGLIGLIVRFPAVNFPPIPLWSRDMASATIDIVKSHFWLLLIFTLPSLLTNRSGGLAWEAHLGGFIAGLLLSPVLIRATAKQTPSFEGVG